MGHNYNDIYEFLTFHRYPNSFSKNQKRILRRKSQGHFRVQRGLLLYSGIPKCCWQETRMETSSSDCRRKGANNSGLSFIG